MVIFRDGPGSEIHRETLPQFGKVWSRSQATSSQLALFLLKRRSKTQDPKLEKVKHML